MTLGPAHLYPLPVEAPEHVQRSLEEYEQFIADEVERSCEEQDLLARGDGGEREEEDEEMADGVTAAATPRRSARD